METNSLYQKFSFLKAMKEQTDRQIKRKELKKRTPSRLKSLKKLKKYRDSLYTEMRKTIHDMNSQPTEVEEETSDLDDNIENNGGSDDSISTE